jgi:hypothetical protein
MVVNRFPKSDPDIEQAQAAAQAANEAVGHKGPQSRGTEQKMVVCPFRPPRQDEKKNSHGRANEYQQQD